MSDREDRERDRERERNMRNEEDERRAETERRSEQLREAWRQRHPDRERLELERASWERLQHEGETVWRNPVSGLVYPQGIAISMLREGADPDVSFSPEGGA